MATPVRKSSRLNSLERDQAETSGPSRAHDPKANSEPKVEFHEIDPKADLLMQLFRRTRSKKAVEAESEFESSEEEDEEIEADSDGEYDPDAMDQADVDIRVVFPEDDAMETEDEAEETDPEDEDIDIDLDEMSSGAPRPETQPVHIRVSSKHMIMASPFFRSMLDNDRFKEGEMLRSKGSVEVSFPEDNPDAFLIILKIIHGLTRQVPRKVEFNMLNELSILVDKNQILEIVEPFSEVWLQNFKDSMGEAEEGEYAIESYLPWLSIYWVFEREEDFQGMTALLQNDCNEKLEEIIEKECLQIPEAVINAIKDARNAKIRATLNVIYELVDKFTAEDDIECKDGLEKDRFTCDAMTLGSLLKSAAQIGIWPKLDAPYVGQTCGDLRDNIVEIRLTDLSTYKPSHPNHGYAKFVSKSLKALEHQYNGVELWDVKQRR